MIAKLLIIFLLAVEQVLADETTSVFQSIPLPAPKTSFNWTSPEASKESNISSNFIITNALSASPFQWQQELHNNDQISSFRKLKPQIRVNVKDLGCYPVDRYSSEENNSQVHGEFSIRNESVESQIDKAKGKSNGFIEFEFDIDDEISTSDSSNTNISANEEVVPYSSTLNRILSSLIPRRMTDIFKLSYVAGPQSSKEKQTIVRGRSPNWTEKKSNTIIGPQTLWKSSVKRQSVFSRDSKLTPTLSISSKTLATTRKASTNISGQVSRKDIHDVNEVINTTKMFPEEIDKSPFNASSRLEEQINLNRQNESDYEDYSLNLGEDNFIAPSHYVSEQLVYPSSLEMQTNIEHDDKYAKTILPALEKQINVQIQDNFGGYGQKLPFSPLKQLDDIHEEVEKQFNPNDIRTQSEAASRKFLKKFKANLTIRPPLVNSEYQIMIKPKTIQPESLLHTYIYSSESSKDPVLDGYSTENNSYVAAVPESANQISEDVQNQSRPKQAHPASILHTYIFPSEFGRNSHSDTYNESDSTPMEDKIKDIFEWNAQPSFENQQIRQISSPQSPVLNSKLGDNISDVRGSSNLAESHAYTTAPYHTVWQTNNLTSGRYSKENNSYVASNVGNPYEANQEAQAHPQSKPTNPDSSLHTYIFSTEFDRDEESDRYNKSDSILIEDEIDYNYEKDAQTSRNQETRKISLQHSNVLNSRPDNNIQFHSGTWDDPITQVDIQKSVNIHNKYITEKNGNLIEQHEIYTRPKARINFDSPQQFKLLETTTPISLSKHPIRVAQAEEPQQRASAVESESIQQYKNQPDLLQIQAEEYQEEIPGEAELYRAKQVAEAVRPVSHPASIENIAAQPYQIEQLVEKYIDRPVHVEHIFEKQVNVPYPVREVVEKIVDRPVPVEKIIDRPVHIPYPVQVDHFIDRPYAVQFPVAVPFPVHRYIDRPYPVEKIVDRPIHIRVPYPVETVVEKIVEKHVPVEVERIVEKPVEKIVQKQVGRHFALKKIVNQPVPIPIPVPVGIPVVVALTNDKNSKRKPEPHTTGSNVNDFLELVPPSLPVVNGQGHGYKTLPENINILLLDESNFQIPNRWGQPVKRGSKSHYIKRSPEYGRSFRVEYGFKPPIVPSQEIDDTLLPLAS